ncbi:MAG: recombinase family protein, partial [Pseudobdellovibrionaceae bacterium]
MTKKKSADKKIKGGYRIGLYIRVSTEEQAENPEGSIKSQECRLREFVKHKNSFENFGEIVELYCDAGISAKDTNRPEFQRMMNDIRGGEINMILITELSRLTRSIKDFAVLVEMLEDLECKIHSLKDNFDTSTAVGSFSMYLVANLAQFERKQIGERISANFLSRAKRGLYNGGAVPLGYRVSDKKDGRLEVVPSEAEVVREVFKTFLAEGTLASATKALNAKKVQLIRKREGGGKTRTGKVGLETLYRMLRNSIYIGVREFKEGGKVSQVKAQWEPIVNEELFRRIGEMLKANKSRKKSSPLRHPYLLSGLLHCQCGHRLSGKSAHGNGGKIAYYDHAWAAKMEFAAGAKSEIKCDPQRFLANRLEPVVWNAVREFLLMPDFFSEILLEARAQSELNTPKQEIDRKLNKIYEINMQLDALSERLGLLPKSVNPKHVFDQMEKLSISKQGLEDEVHALKSKNSATTTPVSIPDFDVFRATITNLLENEADPKLKTTLIQKVVEKIIIKNEEVEIYFFVGEQHYKRELDISGSRPFADPNSAEKRYTSPLPVFHGNLETSNLLNLSGDWRQAVRGSNSLTFGSQTHTLPEHFQVHKNIDLSEVTRQRISDVFVELYQKGLSLAEISKETLQS